MIWDALYFTIQYTYNDLIEVLKGIKFSLKNRIFEENKWGWRCPFLMRGEVTSFIFGSNLPIF